MPLLKIGYAGTMKFFCRKSVHSRTFLSRSLLSFVLFTRRFSHFFFNFFSTGSRSYCYTLTGEFILISQHQHISYPLSYTESLEGSTFTGYIFPVCRWELHQTIPHFLGKILWERRNRKKIIHPGISILYSISASRANSPSMDITTDFEKLRK